MNRKNMEDSCRLLINKVSLDDGFPALLKAIANKNMTLFIHSNNVAFIAAQMAFAMDMDVSRIKEIIKGALLHDIGKLYVPDEILNKPGRLSADELQIIKEHPVKGYEHIRNMAYSDIVNDIVLHHHETENGDGYPDKSTDMILETKIVAVADKFDAISATRPYHRKDRQLYDTITKMEQFKNIYTGSDTLYRALYQCHGM